MVDALYLFGAYRLEPEKGLFRGEQQIPLPPKELELLRLLLSLEGRVVSHQMIEDTLWPRQVVSYASMARCVYSLRKHLDAEGETYIQTVPKRGYRMVAPLRKASVDQSSSARALSIQTTPLAYSHFLEGLREANNADPESQEREIRIVHRPDDVTSMYLAMFAAYLGHYEEALDATYEALRCSGGNPGVQSLAAYVLRRPECLIVDINALTFHQAFPRPRC